MSDKTVVYRLRAELGQWSASMAQASASTKKLAGDLTAVGKEGEKSRRGLESMGKVGAKVGLVAAAGLGAAVVAAANFDSAMSNVEAATHESAGNMEALRAAAIKAGADTAFSASEAAAGIENLAKAGVSTQAILAGGLDGALALAAAGSVDVATAAESAATAMTQFGLSGKDVPHIADLLAAGAGKAQGEVTDLSGALNQSGLVAGQMGLSIEETTGSLAAFASAGLIGSDAGTSLKTMLLRLANPSAKAAEEMEGLGINAYDAQGNFVGLEALAGQLAGAFEGQSQATRDAALATIFGSDAIRGANVLYSQGAAGIADWTDKVNDQGYAAETAAIKLDNLKGDLEAFKGSLETALIGTGEGGQGPLRALTQGATDLVNAYNKLPGPAKDATAGALGLTAVLGGGLWAFSKTVTGIANMRESMSNLGISATSTKGKLKSTAAFLGGPWGIALTGATVAIGLLLNEQAKTEGYVESLTAALEDQTGAMTRQAIAANLQDEGWLKYAESIGLSTDVVVDAALGSAEAMELVNAAADKDNSAWFAIWDSENWTKDADQFVANIEAQSEAQGKAKENARQLAEAENGAVAASGGAAAATDGLATSAEGAAQSVGALTTMTEEQSAALKKSREAASETASSFFGLGEKVDKAKVSLGEWLRDMEKQAAALRDFQHNAQEAGKRGLDEGLITSLEEAGTAGALRMRQLANATDDEIDRANRAWRRGERAIDDYTDAVGGVPPANIRVNNDPALIGIEEVRKRLADLKDKTLTVRITASGTAALSPGFGPQTRAMGGYISGPGSATSDSIPALLSNGEYVIRASAVERYGQHLFDSLNAQRYAAGGMVSASPVTNLYGPSIDYDRLARSMAAIRPPGQLYGDVHVSDGYGGFKRQMMADQQRAGLGGV